MTTTESRRFALVCALGLILFFLYQAWEKDHAPVPSAGTPTATPAPGLPGDVPAPLAQPLEAPAAATASPASPRIHVETDVLRLEIALEGGDIRRAELKGYAVSKDRPNQDFPLLLDEGPRLFVLQSGLAGTGEALVTHYSAYRSARAHYTLAEGQEVLEVPLEYVDARGFTVRKLYRLERGRYVVQLQHQLQNNTGADLTVSPYVRYVRTLFPSGTESKFLYTFTGVGLYQQKESGGYKFAKTDFEDLADDPLEVQQTGGWIALLQHYFLAAILPSEEGAHSFTARPARDGGFMGQYLGAAQQVPAGGSQDFGTRLYMGPKLQNRMGEVAPGLELTIDYGILTPIAEPLFWLLDLFHSLTRNWGFAIILLTLAVKLALYKLSEAQYRSMAKMKKFAPRIQDIKERYGDDRERLQRAMMDLYKKEGFNPLAGCWPLLIQFPVFIALYWVLLESVELRHADFMLWLNDLSSPDPFYVLPVLFGLSMWIQQKLSGSTAAMDPTQQKIMNLMPIMLAAFFAFFPVGLVLYWFVSNVIGIAQQWYITRKLDREGLGAR